jgi:DUF4097 and DUF4098 domain-containing protein YvlB
VLSLAAYAQVESPISREGTHRVRTSTGSAALHGAELRISARGPVSVQGEQRPDLYYSLTGRTRAPDEQSPRKSGFTQGAPVKISTEGGATVLSVEYQDDSAELRVSVPRNLRLTSVETQGGAIEAGGLEGNLRAATGGGHVRADRIGGELTATTGGGEIQLGFVAGGVRCSTGGGSIAARALGGDARLETGGGEISIGEVSGTVRASTGGGNIRIERAGGEVNASTGGGLIDVLQAHGPVVAETGGGSIRVSSASGVRCSSASGAIRLQAVSGHLRAATGLGSILAELSRGKRLEDSALSTGSGNITVIIPSDLAVTVQALIQSAGLLNIVSEFPEIRPSPEPRGARVEAQGALNGGGPLLKLTAGNGTIYLRRQK